MKFRIFFELSVPRPFYPVSASLAQGRLTLPKRRFVCRPDKLAFTGTEPV